MGKVEDDYLDVLQNIEFAIVDVFHNEPDLLDNDVDQAVNALIGYYRAQDRGRIAKSPKMSLQSQQVYESVKSICDWRLGQELVIEEKTSTRVGNPAPLTIDEIIVCLKRIRKSIKLWTKQGGRQGYLQFVDQFIR